MDFCLHFQSWFSPSLGSPIGLGGFAKRKESAGPLRCLSKGCLRRVGTHPPVLSAFPPGQSGWCSSSHSRASAEPCPLHSPSSASSALRSPKTRLDAIFCLLFWQSFFASFFDASSRRLKSPPRRPKTAQDGHKTAQEPSKSRFWWIFEAKIHPSWHPVRIPEPSYVKIG